MAAPVSPALFDQFARGWRGYVLIALIALASSLMGVGRVQVMDDDEAEFALVTRELVETGARPEANVAAHAVQAMSVQAAQPFIHRSNLIWPYRLPSALGVMLAALATLWAGASLVGPRASFFGAGLFAAGMFVGFEGMIATTDALALGFTCLTLAALARLSTERETRITALTFWLALACAVAIAGLAATIVIALTLGSLTVWERRGDWLKPLLWWPGLLAFTAILVLLSVWVSPGALLSLPNVADRDHSAMRGFYLFLLPFLIFPATYALPAAARLAWEGARAPRDQPDTAALRFLIAWALPITLLFELAPTKFAHDALPAFPAIALLCGAGLQAMRGRQWRSVHPAGVVLFAVTGAVIVALMAMSATFMPGDFDADLRRAVSAALIGVSILGAAITGLIMLRRPAARAGVLIACALLLSFSSRERLLPEARSLNVSSEVVAALTRARLMPNAERPLWVVGYSEPSLRFLIRDNVRMSRTAGTLADDGDALIVEGRALQETTAALAARGLELTQTEEAVRGLALGSGDRVTLFLGEVAPVSDGEPADGPPRNP